MKLDDQTSESKTAPPTVQIGSVILKNFTVLAPLAGVTNLPLRLLAKEAGCGLVYSEMVSAHGLVHQTPKTERLLDSVPAEKPLTVQIFGSDPGVMAEAAGIVASSGADIVDINFGCAVKKILKSGSGAALMREPRKAEGLLKKVRQALSVPLTIKIRSGWDKSGDQALRIAAIAEDCGVDAIAVHPRFGSQGFAGQADWTIIRRIKQMVSIPVIGNGDIVRPEDALRMRSETGCDAVMIGRAAISNPMIFKQVNALAEGRPVPLIDLEQRFEIMVRYLTASVQYMGETAACYMLRSRLGWLAKGMPNSNQFREALKKISSETQARDLIASYRSQIGTLF
jgi:nifR3 family TIM-barrel protein